MPNSSLLQRLKERKLVQWALAYLAGGFVVVQILDAVAEPLTLSLAVQRGILAVIVVGFFVTLVLAWYHGEKGRQRVSGPELLMVAALLVIAGGVLSMLGPEQEASSPATSTASRLSVDDKPGIAVLPCTNLSPNPDDAYFVAGLHDDILLKLQKISSLFSIGRTSVLQYAEGPPATNEIASALGVDFVGECSVQKYGNQIRLIFQLLDGITGGQIWAEDYVRDLTLGNLFDIQSDIARQVAHGIGAILTPEEEARIAAIPTESLEAFDRYIRGNVFYAQRTPEAVNRALEQYQLAVEADSLFGAAHARIAMCYVQKVDYAWYEEGETKDALLAEGLEKAESAIRLAPESGDAWVAKGYVLRLLAPYDSTERLRVLRQSVFLDPRNVEAHNRLAWALLDAGQDSAAVAEARKALEIDPRFHIGLYLIGQTAYYDGDLERAEAMYDTAIAMAPDYWTVYHYRGLVRAGLGNLPGARRDAEALDRAGASNLAMPLLALLDAIEGREAEARARLQEFGFPDVNARWARVPTVLGEEDLALDYLEQGPVAARHHRNPFLDPLRDHPRFQALLERYASDVERE